MTDQERIDGLLRHINLVRENCGILAERFLVNEQLELSRALIKVAQIHDNSKFSGIEWQFLTDSQITNKSGLKYAIEHHESTNPHHPRYWGAIEKMPELYVAEMTADWKARATEFGTDLRDWINNKAVKTYKFTKKSEVYKQIMDFVDILCPKPFENIDANLSAINQKDS